MSQLAQSDLEGVLDFLRSCEEYGDLASLRAGVIRRLSGMIRCDSAAYKSTERAIGDIAWVVEPEGIERDLDVSAFRRWGHQHPNVAWARGHDGHAVQTSDLASRRKLHRLEVYDEFMKALAIEDALTIAFRVSPRESVAVVLNRQRPGFSEREREILDVLRPHLIYLHRSTEERIRVRCALEALERSAGHAGRAVVVLDRGESPALVGEPAVSWFQEYFSDEDQRPDVLPEALADWVRAARHRLDGNGRLPALSAPLVVAGEDGRLVVEYLPGRALGEPDVLLLEERCKGLPADRLRVLGLTRREGEVLRCANRGLTDMQIAIELSISPRTVQKHLERVYLKLGVPNRMAALARVRGVSDSG